MEILAIIGLVLVERARLDLHLRRWWARLPVHWPTLPARVPVPVALAGFDARRTALRLTMVGLVYVLWRVYAGAGSSAYNEVNVLVGRPFLFVGVVLIAALGVAGGRDRSNELIDAMPAGPRPRVLGWAVALGLAAVLSYAVVLAGRWQREGTPYDALLPDAWELAQVPAMILGGGLLGLLAARLVPAWLAAPGAVVLAVTWVGTLSSSPSLGLQMLAVLPDWVTYREDDDLIVFEAGSFGWHNAFLFGLCGLGLVAALLHEPGRRRGLLAAGAALLAGTVAAGALALP